MRRDADKDPTVNRDALRARLLVDQVNILLALILAFGSVELDYCWVNRIVMPSNKMTLGEV